MKQTKHIYLDYNLARPFIVDYKDYMAKYGIAKDSIDGFNFDVTQPMKLVKGAPNIICIEGTYIMVKGLPECCKWKDKAVVSLYARAINSPELFLPPVVNFHWGRQ